MIGSDFIAGSNDQIEMRLVVTDVRGDLILGDGGIVLPGQDQGRWDLNAGTGDDLVEIEESTVGYGSLMVEGGVDLEKEMTPFVKAPLDLQYTL